MDPHRSVRQGKRFERKRGILECGARRREETNIAIFQEITPIDGRPDGGLLVECKGIRRGAHDLVAAVRRKHLKKLAALLGRRPIEVEVSLDDLGIVGARDMYQLLERIGRHEIVRLQNANVLAARLVETPVHRVAVSGIGLVDHD